MTAYTTAPALSTNAFVTPAPVTPTATDTFGAGCFGVQGMRIRLITTGTTTNVTVADPGFTASSNPGTFTPLAAPATGTREFLVPVSAINPSTGVASVSFSGALTGVTYEFYRQ